MESQNTGNLANLYRPKTFKEVVGQDLAVSALKRVAHAPGITVRSIFLHGSWGSGKCIHPDTIVRTSEGLRQANSIRNYTPFTILGSSNAFVGAEINAETKVYCIRTERGKVVKVTGNHPVYVWDGERFKFVRADSIKKGDCVVEDLTPMPVTSFDKWAYFVGLLLGDGVLTLNKSNTISFITSDIELFDFVESYCISECWHYTKQTIHRENRLPQYIVRFNRFSTPWIRCNRSGILGHTADTKVLPKDFWMWEFSSQVSLLQGIMDTDGSCSADGSIELGSNSLKLLEDLSHVVQSLGMSVRISKRVREYRRKDGSVSTSYRMYISQVTSKRRAQRLFRLKRKQDNVRSYNNISQIKRYKFKGMSKVIYNYLKDNNIHIFNEDRRSLNTNFNNGEMSCYHCMQWQTYLRRRGYDVEFIQPDIYPDFVKEVTVEQVSHTIDLQCSTAPVFYTSGIITHNTTVARLFGKALNCEHFKENDDVCNECPKCKDAMTRTSQLYMELDATSVGNVDAIRNLSDRLSIMPNGRRAVIFDECHAASNAALNALLKIVEDGVPNTMFIFCSTEDILPTIKSRSLCIDIGTIPLNVLSARIKEIADSRNLPISDQNLSILAMKSQGHMRDALQLLQLYELAGERGLDSSYFKLRSFIVNCLSRNPKTDPELILNDILRYPTADIKLSVGMLIRNIFKAEQGTPDYKLLQAGLGKSLFSYFFSPLSQQALRSEVGTEILLRAFLERTKKPNN